MLNTTKYFIFYVLLFIFTIPINAQYNTSDFVPTSILSSELYAPGRMAIDTTDNVYVVDAVQRNIVKYDAQGNFINTIDTNLNPLSIAVNNKNHLFVGDKNTGDIYTVKANGTKILFYSGLSFPASMEFGLNNILYVVDSEQKKVIGLDVSGDVVQDFTFSTFTFPTGIAFDHQNNRILVSEHGGIGPDVQECGGGCSICWGEDGPVTTIYIFDINGNYISEFGCFGTDEGLFQRIQGITVGACGNIYATDPYLGRVSVFDSDGNYITKFGSQGNGPGEFNIPTDIVFSTDNRAFVSSMNKGAIDVLSVTFSLPTATITSTDKAICAGTTTDITVDFTGVAPWNFTYTQDDSNPIQLIANETPFSFPVDVEGLYIIDALTDANGDMGTCFTGSTQITVSTEPPTATLIITELEKCNDDPSGIELQFTGMAPWTFTYTIDGANPTEISTNQSLYILDAEQSGDYEFFNLSDDACTGTEIIGNVIVTVHPMPSANFTSDDDIFINPGESADIEISFTGTAPFTFTYILDNSNLTSITTTNNPFLLTVADEGTYEIMSVADLYCINDNWQDEFNIFFYDIPPTATIETSDFYLCSDETADISIDFTGTSPWTFSYTIDGFDQGSIIAPSSPYFFTSSLPGVYELSSISDQNTTGTFSGAANVLLLEEPIVNLPEDFYLCDGDPAYILDAGEHVSYVWSDGSTNRTLAVSETGTYSVTTTNIWGCTASDSVSVTVLSPSDANFNFVVNYLEVRFVSDTYLADSHYWDFGDGTFSTDENPIHTFASKGTYTVTYTAINDICGTSVYSEDIYVNTKPLKEVVDIYPNPSSGEFTVAISPKKPLEGLIDIFVYGMSGNPIYSETFDPNTVPTNEGVLLIEIYIGNFTNGMYIVTVNTSNFVEQHQLLLHH